MVIVSLIHSLRSEAQTATVSESTVTGLAKKAPEIGKRFEEFVIKKLKIKETQVTFKNGVKAPYGEKGCPRVDGISYKNGRLIAYEFKGYDLEKGLFQLMRELKRQALLSAQHLPKGSLYRIIINKRKYSKEFLAKTKEIIQKELQESLQKLKEVNKDISMDFTIEYM